MVPNTPSAEIEIKGTETGRFDSTKENVGNAPKPELSKQQIGKLRRQFHTQVYGRVAKCGHQFHPTDQPRTNCTDCWEAFFRVHTGVVQGVQSILSAFGEKELVNAKGTEFVKRYKKFAAMVEQEQKAEAAA